MALLMSFISFYGDTLKQVSKFPSSGNLKFPIFKFQELQIPKFLKKSKQKNIFFPVSTKNILDTMFCLSTFVHIGLCPRKVRTSDLWFPGFNHCTTAHTHFYVQMTN